MTNKLINLEFIRGAAALIVLFGHVRLHNPNFASYHSHLIQAFLNWGTECVMLFFILSGIVVHYSFDKKPKSNLIFLKQRIVRLHPTLLISLLISLLVEFYYFDSLPPVNTIIGNFVPYSTLQGYLAPLLWKSNTAIWSLSFEIFFYGYFALFIIRNKTISKKSVSIWLCLSFAAIMFYYNPTSNSIFNHFVSMLSFSPVWLIGFYIYQLRNKIYTDTALALISLSLLPLVSRLHLFPNYYDPIKFGLFGLTSAPFFLLLLNGQKTLLNNPKHKNIVYGFLMIVYLLAVIIILVDTSYLPFSKIIYSATPILMLICTKINWIRNQISYFATSYFIPFFAYFGKYSYSIYLVHLPIIIGISKIKQLNIYGQVLITIVLTFCISYVLETYVQSYFNRKLL